MNLYNLQQRYRAGSARRGQGGFTMVELAIVLVIAGIILIGALKGTDMINKAKVERTVSDLRGLQGMILEYDKRYGRMPGDCDLDGVIGVDQGKLQVVALGRQHNGGVVYDNVSDPSTGAGKPCPKGGAATDEVDFNTPWKDLRIGNVVDPSRPNLTVAKNQFDDYFGIGSLTMTPTGDVTFGSGKTVTVNVITVHGIPLWLAKAIDVSIDGILLVTDKDTDGGNRGRVRLMASGDDQATKGASGAVWPTDDGSDQQLVSISYQFDRLVP